MKFTVLTLFPEIFEGFIKASLLGKAIKDGKISITFVNIRDFAEDKHRKVDDTPYGGGSGMVMKVEPVVKAVESVEEGHRILLTPRGRLLTQRRLVELSKNYSHIILICGRYEGIDDRIKFFVDEEISIGDYVIGGGEVASMVIIEGVARLVPGVVGNTDSIKDESFSEGLLEYPQYTRPPEFRGYKVPEVLLSGNHRKIQEWRRKQQIILTLQRRPELLKRAKLSPEELKFIESLKKEIKNSE